MEKRVKTALFSPCFLDGVDDRGTPRLWRNIEYLRYYYTINREIKFFDDIWLYDNGSKNKLPSSTSMLFLDKLDIVRAPHIPKQSHNKPYDYPYLWRALYFLSELLKQYDKVLLIDSDCYILTPRLVNYLRDSKSGWETFWVPKYKFPSAELQIINKDALSILEKFCAEKPYLDRNFSRMETELPYTKINKDFVGDRYGEAYMTQDTGMDYYGQRSWYINMVFDTLGKFQNAVAKT